MSTGLFVHRGRNTAIGKRTHKPTRSARFENFGPRPTPVLWPQARVDLMCDLIADGKSFKQVADALGMTKQAVVGRFDRLRKTYGWQAA